MMLNSSSSRKMLSSLGRAAIMCLVLACSAAAATLNDYHKRIDAARGYTNELLKYVDETNPTFERQNISSIKAAVPATEKVEWPGGSIETDNRWLAAALDGLANETDAIKRAIILTAVNERLLAISQTVGELESAIALTRSKDEDKQKLAEILKREEYQKPQLKEESLFQKWIREFLDWLSRVFPKPNIEPGTSTVLGSLKFGLQILIYALVIGLVGFLIYKFAPYFARRFGSKTKRDKKDRVILGERIGEDESSEDLFGEAERLAREGNLRGAIRKGYIALLCELSDRKLIGLARHKTNRDYLRDVRRDPGLFRNMTGLTGSFERNWYGLRSSEIQDWEDFRDRYRQTIGEVRG